MANGDFAKRYGAKEGTTTPVKKDLSGARLRESERTEVKLEGGKLILRKAVLTACAAGAVLGLAATGFGALNVAACIIRPEIGLISWDALTFGLMTYGGFKLTKATLPTTMRNSDTLRPYYDAIQDVKDSIKNGKSK